MNFKSIKDTIIRIVKDFLGVTAVGALFLLICLMFFAESLIFSKEVMGFLIGIAILSLGIGGLISAIFIFFIFCTKKISKLEKTIAEKDKVIAFQSTQLENAQAPIVKCYTTTLPKSTDSNKSTSKNVFKVIEPLSDEESIDEDTEQESTLSEENEVEEND